MNVKSRMLLLLCKEIEGKGVLLYAGALGRSGGSKKRDHSGKGRAHVYLSSISDNRVIVRTILLSFHSIRLSRDARRILSRDGTLPVQFIVGIPRMFANDVSTANEFDSRRYLDVSPRT